MGSDLLIQFGRLQEAVETLKRQVKERGDQVDRLRIVVWGSTVLVAIFVGLLAWYNAPIFRALDALMHISALPRKD